MLSRHLVIPEGKLASIYDSLMPTINAYNTGSCCTNGNSSSSSLLIVRRAFNTPSTLEPGPHRGGHKALPLMSSQMPSPPKHRNHHLQHQHTRRYRHCIYQQQTTTIADITCESTSQRNNIACQLADTTSGNELDPEVLAPLEHKIGVISPWPCLSVPIVHDYGNPWLHQSIDLFIRACIHPCMHSPSTTSSHAAAAGGGWRDCQAHAALVHEPPLRLVMSSLERFPMHTWNDKVMHRHC